MAYSTPHIFLISVYLVSMNEFVSALQHVKYELIDMPVLKKCFLRIFTMS